MITIQGLSQQQRALADIAWRMDTTDEILALRQSLQGQQRRDLDLVLQLIVAAEIDTYTESKTEFPEARDIILGCR